MTKLTCKQNVFYNFHEKMNIPECSQIYLRAIYQPCYTEIICASYAGNRED